MRSPRSDRAFGHIKVYEELTVGKTGAQDMNARLINTDLFQSRLLDICGDVRFLWMPGLSSTTTDTTKESPGTRTVTYSKSIATFDNPPTALGNGVAVHFDGTDEEGDTPDTDDLSFGDGAVDEAFTVLALINITAISTAFIVTKEDNTNTAEWALTIDNTTGKSRLSLIDESASAEIGKVSSAAVAAVGTWGLIGASYDGAGLAGGISIYHDGTTYAAVEAGSGA